MKRSAMLGMCLVAALAAGCSTGAATDEAARRPAARSPSTAGARFVLDREPAGAEDVIQVRQSASHGDEVVIAGRIGGSAQPWVEGRAAFNIVDRTLLACSDREGDDCPVPWDYCCETARLPASMALVKLVDDAGKLVGVDARELLGLKELDAVVVRGTAQRDEAGNLTVLATGLFVRK